MNDGKKKDTLNTVSFSPSIHFLPSYLSSTSFDCVHLFPNDSEKETPSLIPG